MNDLKNFLWLVFILFSIVSIFFCIEARFRYHNKKGIDDDHRFKNNYQYFGQPIYNQHSQLHSYELLLREYNSATKRWQLPADVSNFPLSKIVDTIKSINPQLINSIDTLSLNMTVSQLTDFRTKYFFKWLLATISTKDVIIEVNTDDLFHANIIQRYKLTHLFRELNNSRIKITIENVDSSKKSYFLLRNFLPYIDFIKFNIYTFKKSASHWIDITLAQWQQYLNKFNVQPIIGKIENDRQIALVNQLNINLRQGYAYGKPELLK